MPKVRFASSFLWFTCSSPSVAGVEQTLSPIADPLFHASNSSLRALQATIGNSYKCNTEEHIFVSQAFSLNVFSIQVQAFKVESGRFGSGK